MEAASWFFTNAKTCLLPAVVTHLPVYIHASPHQLLVHDTHWQLQLCRGWLRCSAEVAWCAPAIHMVHDISTFSHSWID
jgi:hypothetical protein